MVKLPPTEFTYGKYSVDIPFRIYMDYKKLLNWLKEQNIIGYCKGVDTEIRPRTDSYAVMIEEDDWQGWCHIPNHIWEKYLKEVE